MGSHQYDQSFKPAGPQGPAEGQSYEAWQLSQGQKGASGEKSRMIEERRAAIQRMLSTWKTGYDKSRGQFDFAEQSIRAGSQQNVGKLTAGLAGSGMLNTTAASNAGRAVNMDMNSQLMQLGAQKSTTEYSKWMDLADIQSNTPYDGINTTQNKGGSNAAMQALGIFAGFAGI